jgi:hypothetical protein
MRRFRFAVGPPLLAGNKGLEGERRILFEGSCAFQRCCRVVPLWIGRGAAANLVAFCILHRADFTGPHFLQDTTTCWSLGSFRIP